MSDIEEIDLHETFIDDHTASLARAISEHQFVSVADGFRRIRQAHAEGQTLYLRLSQDGFGSCASVPSVRPQWKVLQEFSVDSAKLKFPGQSVSALPAKDRKVRANFDVHDILVPIDALTPTITRAKMLKVRPDHFTFEPSDVGQAEHRAMMGRVDQAALDAMEHMETYRQQRALDERVRAFEGYENAGTFA